MIVFFRLGYINAVRNLARSLSAIISMAVAAIFLTTTLSLSGGYPSEGFQMYRQVIGGEAVAYAAKFAGALPEPESTDRWNWVQPEPEMISDLPVFHPEVYREGFLSQGGSEIGTFSADEMEQIAKQPGVDGVYPYYLMPARLVMGSAEAPIYYDTPLRGRDLEMDQLTGGVESLVSYGRCLAPEDDGKMVAVVNPPPGWMPPSSLVGSRIVVELPTMRVIDGQSVINHEKRLYKELEIVGTLALPTRVVHWEAEGVEYVEQLYWHTQELLIPLGTWKALYQEVGGKEYRPEQISLHIPDMSTLENRVAELNKAFPQFSFLSVPTQIAMGIPRGLVDRAYQAPPSALGYAEPPEQSAVPLDLRTLLLGLLYLIAALIVAANMLISINERKDEMGVLKAVGARRVDVMIMALTEALLISLIGATSGFGCIELFGIINRLSNHHPLLTILQSSLLHLGTVLGTTMAASLFFGLIPAVKLSGLTAMEVLRRE